MLTSRLPHPTRNKVTHTAFQAFLEARVAHTTRSEASRIENKVDAAQNPDRAGFRWPFELLQNAHDSGPRAGHGRVDVDFEWRDDELVVKHTGNLFTIKELTALLSGGSSKELDDDETTGRFGTGFLVTHGLSARVDVDGILSAPEGSEHFHIELIRDGDVDSIIENIMQTGKSLSEANTVTNSWVAENPTASFKYHRANSAIAHMGMTRLHESLPYLYATCDRLGKVSLRHSASTSVFQPIADSERELNGFMLRKTRISASSEGQPNQDFTALRISEKDRQSAILVVIDHRDDQHRLRLPDDMFPRMFVQFPIAGSDRLRTNVVLDGKFKPNEERDGIDVSDDTTRELVSGAILGLPTLVRHAVESGWTDAHRLAQLSIPDRSFTGDSYEDWWKGLISQVAAKTAAQPIVETKAGRLPAVNDTEACASFLINANEMHGLHYEDVHALAASINGLEMPNIEIAQDWGHIAHDLHEAGVAVHRLGLKDLSAWVRDKGQHISELPIKGPPFIWIAKLLSLAGQLSSTLAVKDIIDDLIPNQHSDLCTLSDLSVDGGISEEIKDIADQIDYDLRSELLHLNLSEALAKPGYELAKSLIDESLGEPYTESEAIDNILDILNQKLPDGKQVDPNEDDPFLFAASQLAKILCATGDLERTRQCPLVAADNSIVRLPPNRILSPVNHWPQSAQDYSILYTENRVLSNRYCTDDGLRCVLKPLIASGLVIQAPLYYGTRGLIDDTNLLHAIVADNADVENTTIRNVSVGQIALLPSELVQRCGQEQKLAKKLLAFVVNVAAREDQNWRSFDSTNATQAGEQVQLAIRSSIWPFELKTRPWIPVRTEEADGKEKWVATPPTESNLRELLNDKWLKDNPEAVNLLHDVFGFSRLPLMLDTLDPAERREAEGHLVNLLANLDVMRSAAQNPDAVRLIGDAEPTTLKEIKEQLEERNRQAEITEANRNFGYAAQEALANAIRACHLKLDLIDRGYDYEVSSLDDAVFRFEVGTYFLEVKASTTGDVRLTPLQAKTASEYPDRFVLCVIDLRGHEVKQWWTPDEVKPFAKIVTGVGSSVVEVYQEVDSLATPGKPVRLRNEQQLRYGIATDVWEDGISIDEWVQSLQTAN